MLTCPAAEKNIITEVIDYRSSDLILREQTPAKTDACCSRWPVTDRGIGAEKYGSKLLGLYRRFHTHVESLGLHPVWTQVETLGECNCEKPAGSWYEV